MKSPHNLRPQKRALRRTQSLLAAVFLILLFMTFVFFSSDYTQGVFVKGIVMGVLWSMFFYSFGKWIISYTEYEEKDQAIEER